MIRKFSNRPAVPRSNEVVTMYPLRRAWCSTISLPTSPATYANAVRMWMNFSHDASEGTFRA
jgi:hypothetical protein